MVAVNAVKALKTPITMMFFKLIHLLNQSWKLSGAINKINSSLKMTAAIVNVDKDIMPYLLLFWRSMEALME